MSYMSEDKIASIVDRVVSRLQTGDRSAPENPNPRLRPAQVNPPYGCGPTKKRELPTRVAPAGYSQRSRGGLGRGVFADVD